MRLNTQLPWMPILAPSDIQSSALKLWVRATDLALSAGDSVATWADQSGNANDLTQSTASAKPTYRTNIFGTRPAVEFATDDFLICDALASLFSGSDKAFTLAGVIQPTSTSAAATIAGVRRNSTNTPFVDVILASGAFQQRRRDDANVLVTCASANISTTKRIFVTAFPGTTATNYLDGVVTTQSSMDVGTITLDRFAVGCLRGATNISFLNAYVAELALWNVALSSDEAAGLSNYLNQKWFA